MKTNYLIIISFILFISGCANTTIYHWGDYSDTLYAYTNEPSDESKLAHKEELINIIAYSKAKNKKVPPGVNFELATLFASEGQNESAITHLNQERLLFPESEKYVALALKNMEVK